MRAMRIDVRASVPDEKRALLARYNQSYFQCDTPLEGGYEDYRSDEPFIRETFLRRRKLFLPLFKGRRDLSMLDVAAPPAFFWT